MLTAARAELAEEQRMVNKAVGVIAHNVFFMQDKRVEGGVKGLTSRSTEVSHGHACNSSNSYCSTT